MFSHGVRGRSVFCTCDETASVERVLIPRGGDDFAASM